MYQLRKTGRFFRASASPLRDSHSVTVCMCEAGKCSVGYQNILFFPFKCNQLPRTILTKYFHHSGLQTRVQAPVVVHREGGGEEILPQHIYQRWKVHKGTA